MSSYFRCDRSNIEEFLKPNKENRHTNKGNGAGAPFGKGAGAPF